MKFPHNTTHSKGNNPLLPNVFNNASDKPAAQSNRGFAENLRRQISVLTDAPKQPAKASTADVISSSDTLKHGTRSRGTDLPAGEQKLPHEGHKKSGYNPSETQAASSDRNPKSDTGKHSGAEKANQTASVQGDGSPGADSQDEVSQQSSSREETPAVDVAANNTEQPAITITDEKTESMVLASAEQTADTLPDSVSDLAASILLAPGQTPQPAPDTAVAGVTDATTLSGTAFLINNAEENASPSGRLIEGVSLNTLLTGAGVLGGAQTDKLPEFTSAAVVSTPAPLMQAAANSPFSALASKPATDKTVAGTASWRSGSAAAMSPASLLPLSSSTPELQDADSSQLSLSGMIAGNTGNKPSTVNLTAATHLPAWPTEQSADAAADDLLKSIDLTDFVGNQIEGNETGLSGKLTDPKPALPAFLQNTSLFSQAGQLPAAFVDTPMSSALASLLMPGTTDPLAAPEGLDSALMTATAGNSSSGTGAGVSASGLSAALYSQEHRQLAAADARSALVQNNRGLETSLTTTSSLKLPGLDVTFGQAGWIERVGRQMLLQSAQGSSSAQIRLDPPELGSLTVKIQLVDQSAAVNFVSPHAMVRDALEQQASRLQDMFREQGLDLQDVSVSDHSAQSDSSEQRDSNTGGHAASRETADAGLTTPSVVRQSDALIDYYA